MHPDGLSATAGTMGHGAPVAPTWATEIAPMGRNS